MSRTKKGSKGPGFEFWTARPGNRHGGGVGKYAKRITHKIERQQNKPTKGDVVIAMQDLAEARDVLLKQIAESAWNAGAKAEREECAKVCEGQIDSFEANRGYGPEICAEAIRARSNVDVTGPRLRGSGGQQGSAAKATEDTE